MGFRSLQHTKDRRSTSARALPARYVPPSGFGYPLDGFLPSVPCRFCFTPAALLGFTLRSFLLLEGIRDVSARMDPHTVSPAAIPCAEARSRHGRPRFLGFAPSESPWRPRMCLAHGALDAPLGLTLLGSCGQKPWSRFRPTSSHTLVRRPNRRTAPQSIDQPLSSPHPATRTSRECG